MASASIVLFTTLVACAALVYGVPVWQQQEDNLKEWLIQGLADFVDRVGMNSEAPQMMFIEDQDKDDLSNEVEMDSAIRRKVAMKQVESMIQDYYRKKIAQVVGKTQKTSEANSEELAENLMSKEAKIQDLKKQFSQEESKQSANGSRVSAKVEDKEDNQKETILQSLIAQLNKHDSEVEQSTSATPSVTIQDEDEEEQELNLQILKKISELRELLEKKSQLLVSEQDSDPQDKEDFENEDKSELSDSQSTDEAKIETDQFTKKDNNEAAKIVSYLLAKIVSEQVRKNQGFTQ